MSYCRTSEKRSDVYVIGTFNNLQCMARDHFWTTNSRSDMVRHLQEHRQRGELVPFRATRRLKREIRKVGDHYVV